MQPGASTSIAATSSGTGQTRQSGQREQFTAEELAIVMSHFDIGVLDSVSEYPRGSRKAPKLMVVSEQGKGSTFVLRLPPRPAVRQLQAAG